MFTSIRNPAVAAWPQERMRHKDLRTAAQKQF